MAKGLGLTGVVYGKKKKKVKKYSLKHFGIK